MGFMNNDIEQVSLETNKDRNEQVVGKLFKLESQLGEELMLKLKNEIKAKMEELSFTKLGEMSEEEFANELNSIEEKLRARFDLPQSEESK